MHFINKIKKLFHKNYFFSLKKIDVLLTHQDADCALVYNGKKYPPHIGSFIYNLEKRKLKWLVINSPSATIYGDEHFYNAYAFNLGMAITRYASALLLAFKMHRLSYFVKSIYWLVILTITKPSLIVGIQPHPGLCIAGRMKKIPVFDLQHGVINECNEWYGSKVVHQPKELFPTGFLCWDDYSANYLNTWGRDKGLTAIVIGHLWNDRLVNTEAADELVFSLKERSLLKKNKTSILVSLQWGLNLYYPESDLWVMPEGLVSLIKETSNSYNWLLRLHPIQMNYVGYNPVIAFLKDNFVGLDNVTWDVPSELPLTLVLSQVDAHITDMSSTVIEAGYLGVPSALMNPECGKNGSLEKLFHNEIENGIASYVGHEKEHLKFWLEKVITSNKYHITTSVCNVDSFLSKYYE